MSQENIKRYQWRKGQSGNPAGRKKGSRNLSSTLKTILDEVIKGKDPVTGDQVEATVGEILNLHLIANGLNGSIKAIREIYDRSEGRSRQKIDFTGDIKLKMFLTDCIKKAQKSK